MVTGPEYEAMIRRLRWPGLRKLWAGIRLGNTPGWEPGKAFEYLVLRAFELDGADVSWPYSVRYQDAEIEQIDGSVRLGSLYALVEIKDLGENVSVGPIAKLRNQLLRRPGGTVGFAFSSRGFTEAARQVSQFTHPQSILLWIGEEVEFVLNEEKIAQAALRKYRVCVDKGDTTFRVHP